MLEQVKAILKGKAVKDEEGNLLFLKGFVLGGRTDSINQGTDFDMEDMEKLAVYTSPEEIEISRLKLIVTRMQEELDKLNEKHSAKPRSKYKHLTKAEVLEIEEIFKKKPSTSVQLIVDSYDTSSSVISRVRAHKHPKSTPIVFKEEDK